MLRFTNAIILHSLLEKIKKNKINLLEYLIWNPIRKKL